MVSKALKIVCIACLGIIISLSMAYAKSSVYVSLLEDIAKGNVLVTFYSPQCQFSQQFLKLWTSMNIEEMPTLGGVLTSHMINCQEETALCVDQKVKYYPSIRFHHMSSPQPLIFNGRRTRTQLLSFLGKAMLGSPDLHRDDIDDAPTKPPESIGGVMILTDENFDSVTARNPVFVKFYTDWCPHCKQIEPMFPQLAASAKDLSVSLGAVNCDTNGDTCSKQSVPHYPLLALYVSGRQLAVYDGDNSVHDWMQFISDQLARWLASRDTAAKEGQFVPNWYKIITPTALTWTTFDTVAQTNEFLFVKFYAPWCTHCQRLAPVWDRLAHELGQEFPSRFAVASVDCTQEANLCTLHGVRAYPTLLLFQSGKQVDNFRGLRDLPGLAAFARAAVLLHDKNVRSEL